MVLKKQHDIKGVLQYYGNRLRTSLNGETVLKLYIHLFQNINHKTTFLGYFNKILKNYNDMTTIFYEYKICLQRYIENK